MVLERIWQHTLFNKVPRKSCTLKGSITWAKDLSCQYYKGTTIVNCDSIIVLKINQKNIERMHGNFPCMFDYWANPTKELQGWLKIMLIARSTYNVKV